MSTQESAHLGRHDRSAQDDTPFIGGEDSADETSDRLLPSFRVRCFGAFQVELDGRPVINWKVQKARELLAYLIIKGGAPVPREEAWEALWPDQDIGQMQRVLSDTAYHLRRALKEVSGSTIEPLVTQGQRYHLNSALFQVDLVAYEAHLRRATTLPPADALVEHDRALALYRGGLFGAEPFEWAEPYRREHEGRFLKAAHTAAKLAVASGEGQQALSFYRAILAHDPIDEEAARGLMQCYAKIGDTNGVRKAYKVLVESLRRELDDSEAQPLPETTKLWLQLTKG
ncbi:MAG: BTAD domain-containing putative transcriptional regulator [Dehalococcoidia bacterium]